MPLRINIPPLTRLLLGVLLTLSLLNGAIRYTQWVRLRTDSTRADAPPLAAIRVPYLVLIAQQSIFYPWVFLTASFVEQNILTLAITAITILYGGRYLERAWGSNELARFLLLLVLASNLIACVFCITWYAMTKYVSASFLAVYGGIALQSAFLVAFKQLVPEHTVAIAKGIVKVRVKHFPAVFLLVHSIAGLALGAYPSFMLAWSGFFVSWIYLRFYKSTANYALAATGRSSAIRGDASDTFSFASFFPEPLSSPVAVVSDQVYALLVTLRVCTPFPAEHIEAGNQLATARGEAGLPTLANGNGGRAGIRGGGKREEAERRRALALKALDQRLHAASARAQQSVPAGPSSTSETGPTTGSQETRSGPEDATVEA